MKILLMVFGILALLSSGAFLFGGTALAQIFSAIAFLITCTCFGFAGMLELQEIEMKRQQERFKLTKENWVAAAALATKSSDPLAALPPLPGKERYWVAMGETIGGPHTLDFMDNMVSRGTMAPQQVYVIVEGGSKWQRLSDIYQSRTATT